jgi:hypothetical protein
MTDTAQTPEESAEKKLEAKNVRLMEARTAITARLSETTRFIGFGLLAVYFAVRTAETGFASHLDAEYPCILALIGLCGVFSILLDYLQYWFASESVADAMKRATKDYDTDLFVYKARGATFVLKQCAAVIGSVLLVLIFAIG